MYELTYEDGFKLISPFISTAVLTAGGASIQPPAYCHPCLKILSMVQYRHDGTTRCLVCATELGTADDRPVADVLEFKKHA